MPTVAAHPPGTLCWIDLSTPAPEAARAFYGALFGWEFNVAGPEAGFYAIATSAGRPVGGIGRPPPEHEIPPSWMPYFATSDAGETLAAAQARGGVLVLGPMDIPARGVQAVLRDPTGAAFGVWQPKPFSGAGVLDEPGALTWAECNTRDAVGARDFYAVVFGLHAERMPGDQPEYHTLAKDGRLRAGVLQMTAEWGELPPHWTIYVAVADADAALARVQALGGKVHHGPLDTPYGRMAVVADPQGAVFSVLALSRLAQES